MSRAQSRVDAETLVRMPLHVSDDYQMKPGDICVVAESAGGAVVVTLPAKGEALKGVVYTIYAPAGATADVSVNDKEGDAEISTYGDLDADGDTLAVVCAGETWVVVGSVLG
jgi:formylmethanofuran dehydrogenase subunit D